MKVKSVRALGESDEYSVTALAAAGAVGHQFAVLAVLFNSVLIPVWIEKRI